MLYLSTVSPSELVEFALVTSQPLEDPGARVLSRTAPYVRASELRHATLYPGLKRATRAAQAAQHAAAVETELALCVLAATDVYRTGRYRRGIRSVHIARQLDAWDAWGPWLGRRSAWGVGHFLARHEGRGCNAPGPAAGWGFVRLDPVDAHTRWAVRWLGPTPSR